LAKSENMNHFAKRTQKQQFCNNLDEEDKTFKFKKRHVSATPVPSSVCRWNNDDEQYLAGN